MTLGEGSAAGWAEALRALELVAARHPGRALVGQVQEPGGVWHCVGPP